MMTSAMWMSFFSPVFAIGMPGGGELILLLIIGLLVFGGRLPEVARNLGKGLQEFKRGMRDLDMEVRDPVKNAMNSMNLDEQQVPYQPPRQIGQGEPLAHGATDSEPHFPPGSPPGNPAVPQQPAPQPGPPSEPSS